MKRILVALGIGSLVALAGPSPASAHFTAVLGGPGFVAAAPCGGFVGAPTVFAGPGFVPAPGFFPPVANFGFGFGFAQPLVIHRRFGWHDTWYDGPYYGGRSEQIWGFTLPGGR
jgi:hypothetical protein